MKKINFQIIVLVLFLVCIKGYSQRIIALSKSDTIVGEFKIMKINHVKNGYIFDLFNAKDSTWYTLVSSEMKNKKCIKIITSEKYILRIIPYFKVNHIPYLGMKFIINIDEKEIIVPSSSWTGNVYTSENIRGLYYENNNNNNIIDNP